MESPARAARAVAMPLRIENRQRVLKVPTGDVRDLVARVLDDHGASGADLTVVFARDAFVRGLNASYRDVDSTTDVLAFAMRDGRPPGSGDPDELERVLGDVVVSTDRAVVQAARYRIPPERELLKLVTHGVLHLLGHDHERPRERARMKALERKYLRASVKSR